MSCKFKMGCTKHVCLKFWLLLFFASFIFRIAEGQGQDHEKIAILVLDKSTHEGIGNVNIVLTDTKIGTSTLPNGCCNLYLKSLPGKLMISHVSYYDSEIFINKPTEDTITIYLEPKINTLDEITISGVQDKVIPNNFTVIDFSICEGKIFVLGLYNNDKRKYTIKVLNTLLEPQYLFELPDTILPVGLFKDCLNNCHILTKTSAYQIIKTDTTWDVCCKYEINSFHKIMDDCIFQTNKYLFFKQKSSKGYLQSFYGIDVETKKMIPFIQQDDISRYNQLMDEFKFLQKHPPSIRMEFEIRFLEEIMYKPFTNALINFRDTIFHFNFKDGEIDYYSEEKLEWIGETTIDSCLINSIWNDEVIFDKAEKKAYINWKHKLFEINTLTGEIIPKNDVIHSHKMIIYGGYLFYLIGVENHFQKYKTITREKIQ